MSDNLLISAPDKIIKGTITLTGSKSIANRVLLIRALSGFHFDIENMSESDDSKTMTALLASQEFTLDAHHAGTTYRFLTAYLALREGENILTGSDRMKQRPIGPLVTALRQLGADITYIETEGYPPLRIGSPAQMNKNEVSVPGDISSQYLSALLMVGPMLPHGLKLHITGELVSRPYLEMTLSIMAFFGVSHDWTENTITVSKQTYIPKDYFVEADWSAASYYYSIAALADEADITLIGLHEDSLQGDSAIALIANKFGVNSTFQQNEVRLVKERNNAPTSFLEYDFIKQPDIAQTVFTMCAGKGINGLFTGLQTLYIKETDRIAAFKKELAKVEVYLSKVPDKFKKNSIGEYHMIEGKANLSSLPIFETYNDHRMAMALAPLALIGKIQVNDASVVSKSYPGFWKDLEKLGFKIEKPD